jgi:phosphoribosylglycinamide formyltransferase 1
MTQRSLRVVVLVSGRGSNLRALLEACDAGRCAADVVRVVSDRAAAPALALARARGIATTVVSPKEHVDRAAWDGALAAAIGEAQPDLVVLAGFMRIVGAAVLAGFAGRIINVHPALLPAFPGMDGPRQALAARVALSGCTVHVVDGGVDTGPILAQAAVPVLPDDDEARLHARIQLAEHALLPAVVHALARGALVLDSPPRWLSVPSVPPALAWPAPLG